MKKAAIIGIGMLALFAVSAAAIPAASAYVTLHFLPSDSNASYCNTTKVQIRVNVPADETLRGGQFSFTYPYPYCDITEREFNEWDLDPTESEWNAAGYWSDCWGPGQDWIIFTWNTWPGHPYPSGTDVLIGNITLHCNSSEYRKGNMNFTCGRDCEKCYINFRNETNAIIPYSTENGTFSCLQPEETFSKDLPDGWNLISLPLEPFPGNESTSKVLETVSHDAVYSYDANSHKFVDVSGGTMESGIGYFVHVNASGQTWTYKGTPYTQMNVSLEPGLNMIGWLDCSKSISDALSSIEGNYNYIARWNAHSHEFEVYVPGAPFNDFNTMEQGIGYFISAKDGCPPLTENCSAS